MISAYFHHAWVLWFLPLAILPVVLNASKTARYSWVELLDEDSLSKWISWLLKLLAGLAIFFIVIALAKPHSLEQKIKRIGVGAQIAFVLDRSASMDEPFSGSDKPVHAQIGETKSQAASRLITEFIHSRSHDMMGMISFSNSAIYVLPLTDNTEAILSAVKATAGNALFQTNIGAGVTSAVELFNNIPDSGSRVMVLLSDGGGRLASDVQQKIRDWLERYKISLYWIVLRQPGGLSIFDTNYVQQEDSPLPPQIELYQFFKTLNSPFQAFEAEDPQSLAKAITAINQKEKKPISYSQVIPGYEWSKIFLVLALIAVGALLILKLLEVDFF